MAEPPARGVTHRLPVRVYWEDTDGSGIVYHARYLHFAERGRTEFLRSAGIEQQALLAETGIAFAVRRLAIDYIAPARLDDRLDVETEVTALGAARLEMAQRIRHGAAPVAELTLQLACLNRMGRPVRIPAAVRNVFLAGAAAPLPA